MSHTPEPLEVTDLRYIRQSNEPRHVVARASKMDGMEANARRIVAAVNACEGMDTESLESIAGRIAAKSVLQMHENYVSNKAKVAAMEQQRDKLLAALELIMERMEMPPDTDCYCHISPPCHDCVENSGIREAIELAESTLAEVKGESK